jgi:HD superfamily phosphohydrolase YqeK
MDRRVLAYVGAVCALAATAVLWVHSVGYAPDAESLRAAACFVALGFIAQVSVYALSVGARASMSSLPFLTAALFSPSSATTLSVVLSIGVAELLRKTTPIKRVFNVAQLCLSYSVALGVFVLLGGTPLQDGSIGSIPAYIALVTVFQVTNAVAVNGVVAISTGARLMSIWRQNALAVLRYDLATLPVAYCFAVVYLKLGAPGVVLLGVLVYGARQLYSTNRQLDKANRDLLEVMVAAIELRDPYTSGHSQRVSQYSVVIARAVGLPRRQVERLRIAALLHDVGKIDERFAAILQKPGRLTDEERAVIELHPVISEDLVSRVSGLADILPAVRHHHERWDGLGYPDRLAGESIPLFARIITFADTIDAMTTDRPYRPALGPADVRAELLRNRGKQFDPQLCDRLLASPLFQELFSRFQVSRGNAGPPIETSVAA